MDSNNNKFVTNYAFPMRICYLKDEQKVQKPQKQQNPSIAYLSSIIQSQNKRSQSQKMPFRNMNPNPFLTNQKERQPTLEQERPPVRTFYNWRSTKQKSKSQDKPLLTSIVGDNWHKYRTKNKPHLFKPTSQNNSNVSEKQIKQKNEQLQQGHFYEFVKNKHLQPEPQPPSQPKFQTNKPDLRREVGETPFFTKTSHSRHRPIQIFKHQKPKTSETSKRMGIMNSIVGRKNFKAISNFEWSRLSESNNFSLI